MKRLLLAVVPVVLLGAAVVYGQTAEAPLPVEVKEVNTPTAAPDKLQKKGLNGVKESYTTEELQLIELRSINKKLENIQTLLWKKASN